MTPEQMATLVPEPKLAAWLLAKGAVPVWTIRDAMPSDARKARLVQQWVIGERRLYVVLYVQPGKPAVWAIAPELGVVGRWEAVHAKIKGLQPEAVADYPLRGVPIELATFEVKQEHGRAGLGMKKTASGLRDSQEKWWQKWLGAMPVVATTADEALAAIGAAP